jgi:hypothetical protein
MTETLEEAAINCWAEGAWDNRDDFTDGFVEGAKWQEQKMYSEEDMQKCWDASKRFERPLSEGYAPNFNQFIEQFKKE